MNTPDFTSVETAKSFLLSKRLEVVLDVKHDHAVWFEAAKQLEKAGKINVAIHKVSDSDTVISNYWVLTAREQENV